MEIKSRKSLLPLKIAVLSISCVGISHIAISPILADIAARYPQASASLIQSVINAPTLIALPFILFGGAIANRINKKYYIITALAIFTVFGVSPIFLNDINLILISRCLFGVGFGMLLPYNLGLIQDFFGGTKDYQPMMGFQSAVTNGGNILLQLVVGWLALSTWRNGFFVYLIGIPIIVIIALLLPNQRRAPQQTAEAPAPAHRAGRGLPRLVWLYVIGTFIYGYLMVPVMTNTSFLVQDAHLGNSGTTSLLLSTYAIGGLLGGSFYGPFAKRFGRRSAAVGLLLHALGMVTMGFATNLPVMFIGAFLSGYAFASIMPSIMTNVGRETPQEISTLGFAFALVAVNLGNFVSGVTLPPLLQATVGGTGVGKSEFVFGSAGLLVSFVVCLVLSSKEKRTRGVPASL